MVSESIKNALENNTLNLPEPRALPGQIKHVPYVCTGDDAFPLSKYFLKSYPQKNFTAEKRIFGYRLSRMRRISENIFGILANCWRVFRKPFSLKPEKAKMITLLAITFHNWLRKVSTYEKVYISPSLCDSEVP